MVSSYDPSVKYSRAADYRRIGGQDIHPLYKAHSYHTKVPHLAIVPLRSCTTPSRAKLSSTASAAQVATGAVAQWWSAPAAYRHGLETEWKKRGKAAPKWGSRRVILNDLSPAATFIAANYNLCSKWKTFRQGRETTRSTKSSRNSPRCTRRYTKTARQRGASNTQFGARYTAALECSGEVNFIDEALDEQQAR